ncbi:MAG: hypothetical protein H6907_18010 [Hyphomicrobiales bacterium]|nr:hypothetical protein [Hyphomicrobiales bacterium]MCP5373629.1 hypothetical protein [Hyphomicrobiales bacterium]
MDNNASPHTPAPQTPAPQPPAKGMDPAKRVNDVILLSGRLINLLTRENDALRQKRSREVSALLEEKNALCRAYESRVRGLMKEPDTLARLDGETRGRMTTFGHKVEALMDENARLLKIAMEANRRILEIAAEAVQAARGAPSVYAANGTLGGRRVAAPAGVPVSFNKTL